VTRRALAAYAAYGGAARLRTGMLGSRHCTALGDASVDVESIDANPRQTVMEK